MTKHSPAFLRAFVPSWFTLFLLCRAVSAAEPDFNKDVLPILTKYCGACHNPDDREGKLELHSHDAAMKGGKQGAAITPGSGDQSRLIRVLTGQAKPKMPPEDNEAPKPEQIAILKAWIDAGAKGPTGKVPDPTAIVVPHIKPSVPIKSAINALAISPKGYLVALAKFGEVVIVSAKDGSHVKTLKGHRGRVNSVAFSQDGTLLVAGAGEPALIGEAKFWNVATGDELRTFKGHKDCLYAVAISPDGQTIATAGYDQSIKLWSREKDEPLRSLDGHNGAIFGLAFRHDGKFLASASEDRTVKLWNVATGERVDTLKESTKELYALSFAPDGKRLAAAGVDNRIRVWGISDDAKEGTNPLVFSQFAHDAAVLRIAYSADGQTLVSTGEDRQVKVWNAANMTLRATLAQQPDWVSGVAMLPGGKEVVVSRLDGETARLELTDDQTGEGQEAKPLDEVPPVVDYGVQHAADKLPKFAENEPNDAPDKANVLAAPGVATGKIEVRSPDADATGSPARDVDLYRFAAKANDQWIIEINAARSGSMLDSKVEVLHGDGRPVERLLLRAVRDSEIEFRGMNSDQRGVRLKYWDEFLLRQYVYMSGEVCKQFQQRRGPDADSNYYPENGSRINYFDTTARVHALAEPCYVVVPYPIGTKFPNNGLPIFTVNYENDDDAQRKLGKDSRLTFVAPADGEYLIRVGDVRGFSGEKFAYTLTVRRPAPSFSVTLTGNPTIGAASGKIIVAKAERIDNFNGPITVDITGLPPGFSVTSPLVIEAGHYEAKGAISALGHAPQPNDTNWSHSKAVATAEIAGKQVTKDVNNLGTIKLGDRPKVVVHVLPVENTPEESKPADANSELKFPPVPSVTIVPGRETQIRLKVERNGYSDRIPIEVENLPHGVIVNDIGLSGVLCNPGESERIIFLYCEPWVAEQSRVFVGVAKVEGDQASLPMVLHVKKP